MPGDQPVSALPVVNALELQRVSQELGETKAKLADERRRREESLDRRLEDLDKGQVEILRKMESMSDRKVDIKRFEDLEGDVRGQGRLVWIGLGLAIAVSVALPIVMKVIWH